MINTYPTMPREADRLFAKQQADPHYWPDISSEIDTPEEILAEEVGTTPQVVRQMLAWLREQRHDATTKIESDTLARAFAVAVPKTGKLNTELIGTRFLALYWLLNSSGESLTKLAQRAEISKQLLDWHANKLGRALNFHGYQQKAAASRKNYADAAKARWSALSPDERRQRRAGTGKAPAPKTPTNLAALMRARYLQKAHARTHTC
jgi:hypothetical protein